MTYFITDLHLQHGNVISFTKNSYEKEWQEFYYPQEWIEEISHISSSDEWDKLLISHWQEALKDDNDADVYIIGDIIMGNLKKGYESLCKLGEMARIHLIRGNHDSKFLNSLSSSISCPIPRFSYKEANIIPWRIYDCERMGNFSLSLAIDYVELDQSIHHSQKIHGKAILCHYPIAEWNSPLNSIMLYGHVHNNRSSCEVEKFFQGGNYYKDENTIIHGMAINCGCMMPYMKWSPKTIDQLIDEYQENINQKINRRKKYEDDSSLSRGSV